MTTNTTPYRRTFRMVGTLRGKPYEVGEVVSDELVKDFYKTTTEVLYGDWRVVAVHVYRPAAIVFEQVPPVG